MGYVYRERSREEINRCRKASINKAHAEAAERTRCLRRRDAVKSRWNFNRRI